LRFAYKTRGVCSREISFEIENNKVKNIHFVGGCPGNLKGICALAEGMSPEELIKRVKGTTCGGKPTSCPDQLSIAVAQAIEQYKLEA